MHKFIVNCEEKFPVFELAFPEEGQIPNCEVSEEFYRRLLWVNLQYLELLWVNLQYLEMQEQLKALYEQTRRYTLEQTCAMRFPEGSVIDDQYQFNTTVEIAQGKI